MLFRSDRKSTRLNSSHLVISYAVFCLKKKNRRTTTPTSSSIYVGRNRRVRILCTSGSLTRVAGTRSYRAKTRVPAPPVYFFFFNDRGTTEIYPLSLHAALPI